MTQKSRIGIVVVSYGHHDYINTIADILGPQKKIGDKLVLVDNHPEHKAAKVAEKNRYIDESIKANNGGFAAGSSLGAERIIDEIDLLFFLNPDTIPSKDLLSKIRNATNSTNYAAYMPALMLPDGKINSAGNVVHISGLSWCDRYQEAPNFTDAVSPIESLSGACMLIRKEWWQLAGGMDSYYFLYYEDTDISTRIRLLGGKLGLIADASVVHDYDYAKGSHKWFYLERNRPLLILRTWPSAVIILLLPELILVEIGLWAIALLERRIGLKAKSSVSFLKLLPLALRDRRRIQKTRQISSYDFLLGLRGDLNTPALGFVGRNKIVNAIFVAYRNLCLSLLKVRARR